MKFMKLGTKPDTFYDSGDNVRSVSSEIASDFVVVVDGITFNVHKFPLLSKSMKLQKLVAEAEEEEEGEESRVMAMVKLDGFPGGVEAFEICAKFCYGMRVTVNCYNVVAVRCGAEHLQMTEDAEKGNLVVKVETFLNSYVFHGWKDSVIAFKSTKALLPLAADLRLPTRCLHSIVSKALSNPTLVDWSFSHTRTTIAPPFPHHRTSKHHLLHHHHHHRPAAASAASCYQSNGHGHGSTQMIHSSASSLVGQQPVNSAWWIEDVAELDIDFYSDVILSIKSTGRMPDRILGEALEFYALKWLTTLVAVNDDDDEISTKDMAQQQKQQHKDGDQESLHRECQLLERIISLLPAEKGCMSCEFLSKLLKLGKFLGASEASMDELIRRLGLQLEEASLSGLLVPCFSNPSASLYDVDVVQSIVAEFMMQENCSPSTSPLQHLHVDTLKHKKKRRTKSAENINAVESRRSASATHSAKLRVAKLIDAYLAEIAIDANLDIAKFLALAKSIPNFARPTHDALYRAIDVYLKKHPGISKGDRKKLCRLLDCKKLSTDACMHAAQNERLPLRTVVQVLFFEQVRNAAASSAAAAVNSNGAAVVAGTCTSSTDPPATTLKALMAMQENSEPLEGTGSAGADDKWEEVKQNFKALQKDIAIMKVKLSEVEKEHSTADQDSARSYPSSRTKQFLSKLKLLGGGSSSNSNSSSPNAKSCVRC